MTSGHRNSFQVQMNLTVPSVARPGTDSGSMIRAEDAQFGVTVNPGRVDVVVGNRLDELAHDEDAERAEQVRPGEAQIRVGQSRTG